LTKEGIMSEQLSNEAITEQATASVSGEGDIRSRVRSLTLSAIKQRHLEATEVRETPGVNWLLAQTVVGFTLMRFEISLTHLPQS
jgi:hypothetical protein